MGNRSEKFVFSFILLAAVFGNSAGCAAGWLFIGDSSNLFPFELQHNFPIIDPIPRLRNVSGSNNSLLSELILNFGLSYYVLCGVYMIQLSSNPVVQPGRTTGRADSYVV